MVVLALALGLAAWVSVFALDVEPIPPKEVSAPFEASSDESLPAPPKDEIRDSSRAALRDLLRDADRDED